MYKIGICDDDKILCSVLEEQIYELSKEIELKVDVEVWYSGESIQNDLKKGIELDLLFLDIELVQKNGIAVGNFIRNEMENMQTHIVYISSKESYAMQLFKVQPLDFLIKPVSAENIREVLIRSVKQKSSADACFEYQKGNSVFRVPIRNIAYFMSMDKKIIIVKKDGKEEFYGKLKNIAETLFLPYHVFVILIIRCCPLLQCSTYCSINKRTIKNIISISFAISCPYTWRDKIRIVLSSSFKNIILVLIS